MEKTILFYTITFFFISGHQIINALITLSNLSDVNDVKDAHQRVAYAVKNSATSITLTTLCHVIPFAIGIASNYYVTKLVCIYFGNSLRQ
jgi:predicted PurR-regulated permease PerM